MAHRYFVGHRKPDFPMWEGFSFFEAPRADWVRGPKAVGLLNDKVFNEYASLIALRRVLLGQADNSRSQLITIAQHRRFVVNEPIGLPSLNQPWARVLHPSDMPHLTLNEELLPRPGRPLLLASAVRLGGAGVLQDYAQAHFLRDLLRFTATLVDYDLLSNEEALGFLTHPLLIPSPSCGTFTLDLFLEVFEAVEKAAEAFMVDGYRPHSDPYQARVCSFLLERLNSHLLLKALATRGIELESCIGHTIVVSEDLTIRGARVPFEVR